MNKQIPYLFDSVIISSPLEQVSQNMPNTGRARVRVFSKYGNRNGSYITEQVADQLIESAITKHVPVVGFFDPQSQTWASHTGPTLAHGYGYVEDFLGWEPTEDTDGVIRDYAVFSIVLHTDYFEEANKIVGQNQSMELNPKTIEGEWARIDDEEYFIYSSAEMLGFCVIGSNEPCFSASTFFSKNEEHKTQFEQFSSLLFELRAKVEEAKNLEGGEQTMEEVKVVETPVEETVVEETPAVENFEEQTEEVEVVEETVVEEPTQFEEEVVEEEEETTPAEEFEVEEPTVEEVSKTDFEVLQESFERLQNDLNTANETIANYEAEIETLKNDKIGLQEELTAAQATIANYEEKAKEAEDDKKEELVEKYQKVLSAEEIAPIKESVADFSYDELESKLAVIFSRKSISGETKKVPLPEPEESDFAKLMKNYRK